MSIDERHRIALHEAARESWGPDIAGTLMEMLPPGGWSEVATRSDLALVKSDLSAQGRELRTEIAVQGRELRAEIAAQGTDLRAEIAAQGQDLRATIASQGQELRAAIVLLGDRLGSRIDSSGQQLRIDLAESQVRMLKWMVTTILGCSTVIVAATALFR